MLAIVYLLLMVALGDAIGRRFLPFLSIPHRLASAFLCGLLFSSWFTYLVGYIFAESASPMFWANAVFFVVAISVIYFLNRNTQEAGPTTSIDTSETEFVRWDWVVLGLFFVFGLWMMFRTFTIEDGNIAFGHHQYPDFGSTVSIMQSFAYGNNFPTEYPHFSGDRIRYHFLFYFQAGNLEYLGLNPAAASNVLSVFSLTSLLILVMTMGSLLFRSRVAGRIGAALFFFHGSLAFIPFFIANPSTSAVMEKLSKMTMYLNSGFPYRGEDWGVWSQNVFLNQRHFTSSIAIFLLVLIFLYIRNREKSETVAEPVIEPTPPQEATESTPEPVAELTTKKSRKLKKVVEVVAEPSTEGEEIVDAGSTEPTLENEDAAEDTSGNEPEVKEETDTKPADSAPSPFAHYLPYIFAGILLGLLPMWNGPVYLTAAVILAAFLLLFPLRRELIVTGITAAILGLPQVLYLTSGLRPAGYSMFRWGFVIDNAGFFDVLYYTFFTFGFKWVLIALALYFASGLQRRFLAAAFMVFPLTYCFRFSEEVLANHKFLNIWLIIANVFVAFALVKLWNMKSGSSTIPTRVAAIVLGILITIGGAIDLVPVWNSYFIKMKYVDDPLVEWTRANTPPRSVFLSQKYINHQLLLAGRRLFYGDPYYAWSAGYDTRAREALAKRMFETRDPNELLALVKENKIDYIAIDDMIRNSQNFLSRHNEDIVAKYFPLVFTDEKRDYANIKIYKVPDDLRAVDTSASPPTELPAQPAVAPAEGTVFEATEGNRPGQLARPRGIAVDASGNIFVADTNNARVQKFDPSGKYLSSFGERGNAAGQFEEPNGVAVDAAGSIYVTDAKNHKLLRLKADGQFDKEWSGPGAGNFYGPRDLVIGPNKLIYVIDQGGTRICKLDPAADTWTTWGTGGSGERQFNEPSGITIGGGNVFVADANNDRVQVFDLEGKFLRQFAVPAWEKSSGNYPDVAYDEAKNLIYVTSGRTNEVLVFDAEGRQIDSIRVAGDSTFNNPSSLLVQIDGKARRLLVLNTGSSRVVQVEITSAK